MRRRGAWLAATALVLAGLATMPPGTAADGVLGGAPLQPGPEGTVANGLAFVGDQIYASFRPAASPGVDGVVYRTSADGAGTWTPVTAPSSDTPLSVPTDALVARGDAMVVPASADGPSAACGYYRLITSTGERSLESGGEVPVLGRGGELVARRTIVDGNAKWVVERVSDGVVALTTLAKPAMDAGVIWRVNSSSNSAAIVGTNTGTHTTFGEWLPPNCKSADLVDVAARFALVDCEGSRVLIDVAGTLTPRLLAPGAWKLADGFAYDEESSDPNAPDHRVIRVIDFTRAHTMRTYGPSGLGGQSTVGRAEPDDGGGHALAMLTEDGQVQRLDLSWVGTPPTAAEDTIPPVIDQTTGSPASVPGVSPDGYPSTPLTFSWTAHDPGDEVSPVYDVRAWNVRDGRESGLYIPGSDGTFSNSVVVHEVGIDTTVCFQVRARDWVGNLSVGLDGGWSAPRCTRVASKPPTTYGRTDIQDRFGFRDALGPAVLSYRYGSFDDFDEHAVSYDVDYRLARPGQWLSGWTSPASWQHITSTSVSHSVPAGGEICFRARGRDTGGGIGAYSLPRCVSVPYDDRAFRIHDGAKRVRRQGALGHTATRLWGTHGSMSLRGVRGQDIWVRIVGGRPDVCAAVTLDGRRGRGGCQIERMAGAVWQGFHFRAGSHGRLRIRGGAVVDAVAVLR